ncbi:MAG: hypothetical protein Q9214_002185 [Letrouitia sp. 1 TL-2023]
MSPLKTQAEPIAVIGTGCRFPGESNTASKLWGLLQRPRNVAQRIPHDRFNLDRFYHPDGTHHGTSNVQESYFLTEDVSRFDTQFFGVPPAEAEPMDPQHRVLMESVYEAIENGGLTLEGLQGSDTAVYVGLMCSDYYVLQAQDLNHIPTYNATGIANSNASSRLSYFFDWHGPSMTIDTACSSSLVAVHQAIQALRSGISRVSVAAGTNLLLCPLPYISESNLNMLSPTGRSRMWDASADGYARGEGVAAVVLKTLSSAVEDGDHIECIIRETGVNQDGKTKGITMPSAIAQASLIKETYARAGLDLNNKDDRCQYFEAHGTGNPAGDPQEAEALSTAFFPNGSHDPEDKLYVGSVKTVIGHTEGTAGVAGLLKACLALKHATIPPNLLFENLSPRVEPYYKHLCIETSAKPWPKLSGRTPRRASVNSFGFGGTNAHAILESYEPEDASLQRLQLQNLPPLIPFVFSATSEKSLAAVVEKYLLFIKANESIDLRSLANTLSCRRSAFPYKIAFSAATQQQLSEKMEAQSQAFLKGVSSGSPSTIGVRSLPKSLSILGIFTGQGAQWATMGSQLIRSSKYARQAIDELDQSLQRLPRDHRPKWTIIDELSADSAISRIGEAELSQPLCTAVQIVLVRLLYSAGIQFKSVVGHSSGEIVAAYAAGFINATDAIRIAYYRGLFAKLASGRDGKRGAMIAVGTSFEDAKNFCQLEDFEGRLSVAASNSSTSVTISGDVDAIEEAHTIFEEEKRFNRILKVDTAYHSHHMLMCSDTYFKALQACDIKISKPKDNAPMWFSSVHGGKPMDAESSLKASYWVDNMTRSVLFSQALETAVQQTVSVDLVLEIGPHAALKGPATETIQRVTGNTVLYSGTLTRGRDDVESFSDALGFVWSSLGASSVDFASFQIACYQDQTPVSVLQDLPTYPWDHDRVLWSESRSTKLLRTHDGKIHDLLGVRSPDGTETEWRWQNVLKPKELPWLSGHALQGQTVYPGTGYIALAMEASMQIADNRPVRLIELCDLQIRKAIAINDKTGAEILVTMTGITSADDDAGTICAQFTSYSAASKDTGSMAVNAFGRVIISLGEPVADILPPRSSPVSGLSSVDIEQFYSAMGTIGYIYDGPFKGLSSLRRRLGSSSGTIVRPPIEDQKNPLLFHPGMLDTALQGMFAAFSAPGDGRLWSMHAPTSIRRVSVVPSLCGANMTEEVAFDCAVTESRRNRITGDVDVFSAGFGQKLVEVDGLSFSPFSAATQKDDSHLFAEALWGVESPDGELVLGDKRASPREIQKASDAERAAFYYLRTLNESVTPEERTVIGIPWHHQALFDNAARVCELVRSGKHPYAAKEWTNDTHEQISAIMDSYGPADADFNLTRAVGENLPAVIRGETTILEHMTKNDKLDNYYKYAIGFEDLNTLIAGMVGQISHKRPQMNILEIGAGTGGSTRGILSRLGSAFATYTYTDISSGFFEKAQEQFSAYAQRMTYKTLNVENDPTMQGFAENAYDLVLAANVLHATKDLEETLRNTWRLLKPGGYLVLMEIVDNDPMRIGLVMGGLSGWWIGRDSGRRYAPTINLKQWNTLLKTTGFSGIDTYTPLRNPLQMPGSIFAAQAMNDDINMLRSPLLAPLDQISAQDLILLGGSTLETSQFIDGLQTILKPRYRQIIVAETLDDLDGTTIPPLCSILSLMDCDSPFFTHVTEQRWETLKNLLIASRNVLWVTRGSRCEEPYAAMTVGLFRSITYELPQAQLQLLDIDHSKKANATTMAELLLRLELSSRKAGSSTNSIPWPTEPELMIENERLNVLRVIPHKAQNDRYNSAKRQITKDQSLASSIVNLEWQDDAYVLREESSPLPSTSETHCHIHVDCSLLSSIKTPAGRLFFSLGIDKETGDKVLAVSHKNASTVCVPKKWTIPVDVQRGIDAQYLSFVTGYVTSQQILEMMPAGGTVLIHEPDPGLASLLSRQMAARKSRIVYTTSESEVNRRNWLYIHPRSPRRSIDAVLPKNVSMFLDLSTDSSIIGSLGSRISASLSEFCERAKAPALIAKASSVLSGTHSDAVTEMLKKAGEFATSMFNGVPEGMPLHVISLRDAVSQKIQTGPLSVVSWRGESTVPVEVETIEERQDFFEDRKTYWLAGLSGDLGQSICDWMVAHGARYIVLTSRSPKVPEEWIQAHKAQGTTVTCIKA